MPLPASIKLQCSAVKNDLGCLGLPICSLFQAKADFPLVGFIILRRIKESIYNIYVTALFWARTGWGGLKQLDFINKLSKLHISMCCCASDAVLKKC